MTDLNLKTFNKLYPMMIRKYSDLIIDQNASEKDKINSIILKLNALGKLSNDVVRDWNTVYQWAMNDGLTQDVNNKLEDMLAKGQLKSITDALVAEIGDLTTLTTPQKDTVVHSINSLQSEVTTNTAELADIVQDVKTLGAKGDGVTNDAPILRNIISNLPNGATLYFPSGTYLLSTMQADNIFIPIKSNITIKGTKGTTIKVANGINTSNTFFQSIFGDMTTNEFDNITFEDITFDMNGQNNLQPSGKRYKNASIVAQYCKNITVQNCTFKNCAGEQIISLGLDKDSDAPNIRILNNDFSEVGQSITGNYSADHSSIYVRGNQVLVQGNTFKNMNQTIVNTAIEVDGYNVDISNNHVEKYGTGVIVAGLVNSNVKNFKVINNRLLSVATGISIWCNVVGAVNGIDISHNTITLYDDQSLLQTYYAIDGVTAVSVPIKNITISNNDISCSVNISSLSDAYNNAIGIISGTDLKIHDNFVHDLTGRFLYIGVLATYQVKDVMIHHNIVKDVGQKNHYNYAEAIAIQTTEQTNNVQITNNEIVNDATNILQNGISLYGKIENLQILDNYIKTANFDIEGAGWQKVNTFILKHLTNKTFNLNFTPTDGSEVMDIVNNIKYISKRNAGGNIWMKELYRDVVPTTGGYNANDIVWNTNVNATNNNIGWICTTGGTPGTWNKFGAYI